MGAIPPLIKTWQMAGALGKTLCMPVAAGDKSWPLVFFPALTAFPLNPIVILGSSNSITAALDGVNRWTSTADIVTTPSPGTGVARSWIAWKNPVTGASFCLHGLDGGEIVYSPQAAFTGGSLTARPTSVEEQSLATDALRLGATFNTAPTSMCLWHTTDGKQTMVVCHGKSFGADSISMIWLMGNVHNALVNWPVSNMFGFCQADRSGGDAHSACGSGTGWPMYARIPAGGINRIAFVTEGVHDGGATEPMTYYQPGGDSADLSGPRNGAPYAVYAGPPVSGASPTFTGAMGCWPDLLNTNKTAAETWVVGGNGNFPDAGKTRAIIGLHIYPWDGVTAWNSDP